MTHRPFSFLPPPSTPYKLEPFTCFSIRDWLRHQPVSSSFFFYEKKCDVTKYEKGENKTIAAGVLLGVCEKKGAACGFLNAG
jgi:D-lyxose ketol-isomerase